MRVSSWARAHALKADNARRTTDGREDGNVGVGGGVLEPATPATPAATSVFLSVVDGRAAGRRSHLHKRHRVLLAPIYSVEGRGVAYSGLRRVFVDREVDEVIVPGHD